MNSRGRNLLVTLFFVPVVASCSGNDNTQEKSESSGPLKTAAALLELHGLLGVQPEQRSDEARKNEVDRKALGNLVADLDCDDRFIVDIYVGFVVGALARNQDSLTVSTENSRGRIRAGSLRIWLVQKGDRWKIVLSETIPDEIKKRALEEKTKVESRI